MKSYKRITLILLIILIYFGFIFLSYNVMALQTDALTDVIKNPVENNPEEKLKSVINPMLTIIQILAIGIAVILIINDGIKYVTAADSASKANIKRKIAYYIIGGILIFAPVTITKYLMSFADTASELVN